MIFTKEQFDILSQYEANLNTAYKANWVRIETRKAVDDMDMVFRAAYKSDTSGLKSGCTRCLLRDVKRLGKDYYADKQEREELAKKEEEAKQKALNKEKQNKAATTTDTKKKATTTKKK